MLKGLAVRGLVVVVEYANAHEANDGGVIALGLFPIGIFTALRNGYQGIAPISTYMYGKSLKEPRVKVNELHTGAFATPVCRCERNRLSL